MKSIKDRVRKYLDWAFGPEQRPDDLNPEVKAIVQAAASIEYGLWIHYNAICKSYMAFINSADKKERINYLSEIRDASWRLQDAIKRLCLDRAVPGDMVRTIDGLTFLNLDNLYLNLTHLFQLFVHATTVEAKMHYLTPIFFLCKDICEVVPVTSAEPNKHLDKARENMRS